MPAADLLAEALAVAVARGAEHAGEGDEAVVPVVIAGDEEQLALRRIRLECQIVGRDAAILILFDGGIGVGEVAAEDQDIAGRQPPLRLAQSLDGHVRGSHQIGHRVGRLKAIAEVGDEIDPEAAAVVELDRRAAVLGREIAVVVPFRQLLGGVFAVERGLHRPLVGVLANRRRQHRPHTDLTEDDGIEPIDHLRQLAGAQLRLDFFAL